MAFLWSCEILKNYETKYVVQQMIRGFCFLLYYGIIYKRSEVELCMIKKK